MTSKSPAGAVGVDREERHRALAHLAGEVEPGRVGALGDGVGAFVEDLVEDLEPLVGQPDLVGVGVDEQPGDRIGSVDRHAAARAPSRCTERASRPWPGAVRSAATGWS